MHLKKLFLLFVILFLPVYILHSQNILTLENALETTLKNNYSIIIAKNESDIAKNSNTVGNAGMLPKVNASASGYRGYNDIKLNYSTGMEVDRKNNLSRNMVAGVNLYWTLFDGFNMFITKEKLNELEDIGLIKSRIAIENTVSQVINLYYDIVRQKKLLKVIENTIEIDKEKLRIAELKFNLGAGSNLDYLQSKVDLNAQKSAYLTQQENVVNAKISLNYLLAKSGSSETGKENYDFEVEDTIPITYKPALSELKTSVTKQNNLLMLTQKNTDISGLDLKLLNAQRYPELAFTLGYNYSLTKSQSGFILTNQSLGWAPGFTATMNLFNGFNLNTSFKNAKISLLNSQMEFEDVKKGIDADLEKAFRNFQSNLQILNLEEENIKIANENIKVAFEKYKLGTISEIVLHEAEISYQEAQTRLVNARYNTKISETELMKLNGELVH
jgi:outer membrane protein